MTHPRGLQPKGNEINEKEPLLLLMPATIRVDRQNQKITQSTLKVKLQKLNRVLTNTFICNKNLQKNTCCSHRTQFCIYFSHHQIFWTFSIIQVLCVIILGGEETRPWCARIGGNPISATIPVEPT